MTPNTEQSDTTTSLEDNFMDTSINDARWLLGGVATLGMIVMALGVIANALAV